MCNPMAFCIMLTRYLEECIHAGSRTPRAKQDGQYLHQGVKHLLSLFVIVLQYSSKQSIV